MILTTTRSCLRFGLPFATMITPALAFSGNSPSSILFAFGLFSSSAWTLRTGVSGHPVLGPVHYLTSLCFLFTPMVSYSTTITPWVQSQPVWKLDFYLLLPHKHFQMEHRGGLVLNTSERKHTHCPWKLSLLPIFPTSVNGTTIYTPKEQSRNPRISFHP